MGFFSNLFGKKNPSPERPNGGLDAVDGAGVYRDSGGQVVYNLLDPAMKQFMGRSIGAIKKAGIPAKGTGQFSIRVGTVEAEIVLGPFWEKSQQGVLEEVLEELVAQAWKLAEEAQQ